MTQPPKGYRNQSQDPIGMWDPELAPAIHFVPFGVKLFDGVKFDKNKPTCLVLGRLVDETKLRHKVDDEGVDVIGKAGDVCGVWFKPGMKALVKHGGHKVWMSENGTKDVGKGNPMKLYDVLSPNEPNADTLPVLDDQRDKSKGVVTSFDKKRAPASQIDDTDNVPF